MWLSAESAISTNVESLGAHIVAYYCSQEHMLLKAARFLVEGIRLGDKCLCSLAPEDRWNLEKLLVRCGVNVSRVKRSGQLQIVDSQWIYDLYLAEGASRIARELEDLYTTSLQAGFAGVRSVVDTKYGMIQVNDENFLHWEQDLNQILMRIPMVKLCLYDIQDLLNKDDQTSSKLIFRTMDCHRYFLNDNTLLKSDDFVKNRA